MPCVYKGPTQDDQISVYYMNTDHNDEIVKHVKRVGMPQYTKKGMELEYFEEKDNEWRYC